MSKTWLTKQDVIYQILIDRFAGFPQNPTHPSTDFIGGNLKGIIDKLPYFKDLGVTTLWISPFYKTSAYHGYHITDFFSIDPHFGSEKDLITLITKVHELNMKIIADFVPNHCSKLHPFFQEAQKDITSSYRNWFYFTNWPSDYLCFLSVDDLPKLNLSYRPCRDHIIDAALFWLSKGFDGYRLDHVIGPSKLFWKQFVRRIKKSYPDTVLIGEAWMQGISLQELKTIQLSWKYLKWIFGSSSDWLLKSYVNLLDGVLDFTGQQMIQNALQKNLNHGDIEHHFSRHYRRFPNHYLLPIFLDNHDMDRFLFQVGNQKKRLCNAAQFQFSLPQPVIIYYGTEIGMTQQQSVWSQRCHGDSLARQPMIGYAMDKKIYSFYKKLISTKKNQL